MAESTMVHVVVRKGFGVVAVEQSAQMAAWKQVMSKAKGKTVTRSCMPEQVEAVKKRANQMKDDDSFFCPWLDCEGESCICKDE